MAGTCPHGKLPVLTYIQEEPVILRIIFGGSATHLMHRLNHFNSARGAAALRQGLMNAKSTSSVKAMATHVSNLLHG